MVKKIVLCILILFAMIWIKGCLFTQPDERTAIFYQAIGRINKRILSKYHFKCSGSGGSWPEFFEYVHLSYDKKGEYTVDEVRQLAILVMEEIIDELKKDPKLVALTRDGKISHRNVSLFIGFDEMTRHYVDPPFVSLVIVESNDVVYSFYDRKIGRYSSKERMKETYEEAREKVLGKRQETLLNEEPKN